jgi:hypothetical protein
MRIRIRNTATDQYEIGLRVKCFVYIVKSIYLKGTVQPEICVRLGGIIFKSLLPKMSWPELWQKIPDAQMHSVAPCKADWKISASFTRCYIRQFRTEKIHRKRVSEALLRFTCKVHPVYFLQLGVLSHFKRRLLFSLSPFYLWIYFKEANCGRKRGEKSLTMIHRLV